MRRFEIRKGKRENTPLLLGLVGPSGSGKTYSALRLAKGICSVSGKRTVVIDTEARRALHYADAFDFEHLDFSPPFASEDYHAAIEAALSMDPGCIVVDSMTHEHSGEGGMLDRVERFLDKKCGDDFSARKRFSQIAFANAKAPRKALENYIVQVGGRCAMIFCYRAKEKLDFKHKDTRGEPTDLGFQPDTTSDLMFEMTQQFLLYPGAQGVPVMTTAIPGEGKFIKTPEQFRDYIKQGEALSESVGERMARWAAGPTAAQSQAPASDLPVDPAAVLLQEARDEALRLKAEKSVPNSHMAKIVQSVSNGASVFNELDINQLRRVIAALQEI